MAASNASSGGGQQQSGSGQQPQTSSLNSFNDRFAAKVAATEQRRGGVR